MYEHDVLIIGGGIAGLRAAVEVTRAGADVAVISKVHPVRSHSNAAQGGINAPLTDRGDDWEGHKDLALQSCAPANIRGGELPIRTKRSCGTECFPWQ